MAQSRGSHDTLQNRIEDACAPSADPAEALAAFLALRDALTRGEVRAASPDAQPRSAGA